MIVEWNEIICMYNYFPLTIEDSFWHLDIFFKIGYMIRTPKYLPEIERWFLYTSYSKNKPGFNYTWWDLLMDWSPFFWVCIMWIWKAWLCSTELVAILLSYSSYLVQAFPICQILGANLICYIYISDNRKIKTT